MRTCPPGASLLEPDPFETIVAYLARMGCPVSPDFLDRAIAARLLAEGRGWWIDGSFRLVQRLGSEGARGARTFS